MDFLLPVLHAVDAGDKLQMLHHGEVIKKARLVRHEREASFGSQRIVPKSELTNADLAARRRNNAGNAAQRRCFARAVWADQPHHLSRFHAKGKIRHGRVGTVDLRQPVDINQWLAAFPCARGHSTNECCHFTTEKLRAAQSQPTDLHDSVCVLRVFAVKFRATFTAKALSARSTLRAWARGKVCGRVWR